MAIPTETQTLGKRSRIVSEGVSTPIDAPSQTLQMTERAWVHPHSVNANQQFNFRTLVGFGHSGYTHT